MQIYTPDFFIFYYSIPFKRKNQTAVRRAAIAETARLLKPGGTFLLVDWSRPRFGLWGIVWYPFCRWGEGNRDNWNNVYPELCRERGLKLKEDDYINSISRRQVFVKEG